MRAVIAAFLSAIGLAAAAILPASAQVSSGWVSSTAGPHNFAQVTDRTDPSAYANRHTPWGPPNPFPHHPCEPGLYVYAPVT